MNYIAYSENPYERNTIMNAVSLVKKFPNATLVVVSFAAVGLIKQSISLRLARLTTLQITRAAEDLKIDDKLIKQMEDHGPYYK
jgi:hypothetical protein